MSRRLSLTALIGALALSVLGAVALNPPARATSGNQLDRLVLSDGTPRWLTGHVVERLRAGPYTYLRVRSDGGPERWVASLSRGLTASDAVAVRVIADAPTFESRRLSRTFSPLIFGVVQDASPPKPSEHP